jgi:hypothetical protein
VGIYAYKMVHHGIARVRRGAQQWRASKLDVAARDLRQAR